MNRRDFLKSLILISTSVAIPFETIASAPESAIERAWQRVEAEPQLFYVLDSGLLTTEEGSDAIDVSSRAALWGRSFIKTRDQLISFADDNCDVPGVIESILLEDGRHVQDWKSWIDVTKGKNLRRAINEVNRWLAQAPNEVEIELACASQDTGPGEAYLFFSHYTEYNDELDIALIDSGTMYSRYIGAELCISVEEANARAQELCLPLRFAAADGEEKA